MPRDPLIAEHLQLRLLCDRLRLVTAAPDATVSLARWRKVIEHELAELEAALDQHFDREERGGYLRNVVSAHPELIRRAETLLRQHRALLDEARAARTAVAGGAEIDQLRSPVRSLLANLSAHESNETEMIQTALQQDTGCPD